MNTAKVRYHLGAAKIHLSTRAKARDTILAAMRSIEREPLTLGPRIALAMAQVPTSNNGMGLSEVKANYHLTLALMATGELDALSADADRWIEFGTLIKEGV